MKITISLPETTFTKTKKYVEETGRTLSGLINLLLIKTLQEKKENGD